MSLSAIISSSETKVSGRLHGEGEPASCALWRGGSFSSTLIPRARPTAATLEPTCPAPTTPRVIFSKWRPRLRAVEQRAEATYCATDPELQPGAALQAIPALSHQAVSIWSNPMVAVATALTEEPSRRAMSHRVRVRTIRPSASLTSEAPMAPPGR